MLQSTCRAVIPLHRRGNTYGMTYVLVVSVDHLDTPLSPSISIPFGRDPDFVNHGFMLKQLDDRFDSTRPRTALVGSGGSGYVNRKCRSRPLLTKYEESHISLLNSRTKPTSSHRIHGFSGSVQAMRPGLSKATRRLLILSSSLKCRVPRKIS